MIPEDEERRAAVLESLITEVGIVEVLNLLEHLCYARAEDIYARTAKAGVSMNWTKAGKQIAKVNEKIHLTNVEDL